MKILLTLLLVVLPFTAEAHSGRTDNKGCHRNVREKLVHCHGEKRVQRVSRRRIEAASRGFQRNIARRRRGNSRRVARGEHAYVVDVVDGDTIRVRLENLQVETVRLLGIDAPELSNNECYAKNAQSRLEYLVKNKNVSLERGGDNRDKYGRLLRYVHRDKKDIGYQLLCTGHAKNYPWFFHSRKEKYRAHAAKSESAGKGLWGECE